MLCLSLLLDLMANSSLIVAAPSMTRDLSLSSSGLEWVIDAYTIPYAALMLALGAIGDKYSRRGALIAGLLVFGAGSAAGSLVHSTAAVIAARAVMGSGAAIIMPSTLSLLVAIFSRRERARAITAWTGTSGLAVALGPGRRPRPATRGMAPREPPLAFGVPHQRARGRGRDAGRDRRLARLHDHRGTALRRTSTEPATRAAIDRANAEQLFPRRRRGRASG